MPDRSPESAQPPESQFTQLVAGVQDYAIFLLDPAGIIRTWNEGAQRIKGYLPHEIIGSHFSRFYPAEQIAARWPEHELEVAGARADSRTRRGGCARTEPGSGPMWSLPLSMMPPATSAAS